MGATVMIIPNNTCKGLRIVPDIPIIINVYNNRTY